MQFSNDGKRLLIPSSDKTTYLYDIRRNIVVQRLADHRDSVTGAVFARDDRYCFSVSLDRSCIMWDLRLVRKPLRTLHLPFPGLSVGCSPVGLLVVTGLSRDVHVYDPALDTPLWRCGGHGAWPSHVTTTNTDLVYTCADYDSICEVDTFTGKLKVLCDVELEAVFEIKYSSVLNALRIVGLPHEEDMR